MAVVDDGRVLAKRRIGDDVAGLTVLLGLLAEHGGGPGPVDVAIETDRGLLVAAGGRQGTASGRSTPGR